MTNFLFEWGSKLLLAIYLPLYNRSPKRKLNLVNTHMTVQNSYLDTERVVSNRTWPKLNSWASPLHSTCTTLENFTLIILPWLLQCCYTHHINKLYTSTIYHSSKISSVPLSSLRSWVLLHKPAFGSCLFSMKTKTQKYNTLGNTRHKRFY